MKKKEISLKYTFLFKDSPFESHVDFEDMLEEFYTKKGVGFEPISLIEGQRGPRMIKLYNLEIDRKELEAERQQKFHKYTTELRTKYEANHGLPGRKGITPGYKFAKE